MPITDIFKAGKFTDDLQKSQKENTVLKTTLAELAQMDAANLKAAISELEVQKSRCAREVQKAEGGFANKRRSLDAQLADLIRQIETSEFNGRSLIIFNDIKSLQGQIELDKTMTSKLTIPQSQIDELKDIRRKRLAELHKRAETIQLVPLPKGKSYKAIAISVDASNVPVETDVVDGVAVRCADSNGVPYFQGLVPTDGPVSAIQKFLDKLFTSAPVLQNLLQKMRALHGQNLLISVLHMEERILTDS